MKAMRFHSYGDSDVLVYEETERPVAGAGQVLVQVAGAAFNPLDVAIRGGYVQQAFPITFPHTPNYDLAGMITEVGPGVSGWQAGDRVVAVLAPAAPGAAAEYAVVPAEALAAAPRALDLADAAALPSVGLTAWQALFEQAGLQPGQRILINGAGGAVGGYAVPLAKQSGAIVTATASPGSAARVHGYGADQVIDHTVTPVTQELAGQRFDVVLNLVRTDPAETTRLAAWPPTAASTWARPPLISNMPNGESGRSQCSCAATPPSSPGWWPGSTPETSPSMWPPGGR